MVKEYDLYKTDLDIDLDKTDLHNHYLYITNYYKKLSDFRTCPMF